MTSYHLHFRVLSLIATLLTGSTPAVADLVSGTITQHRTLSGSNTVEGKVTVPAGVVLTISPGTTLLMKAVSEFEVRGRLLAEGTLEELEHSEHRLVRDFLKSQQAG